jgi:hypothetical protein
LFLFGNLETFIFLQFLFSGESLYSSNTYFLEPLTIDQLYFLY